MSRPTEYLAETTESTDKPRGDLRVPRDPQEQREQREQHTIEEIYEIYEEKEEKINSALIKLSLLFVCISISIVSVASVAKANTLSISPHYFLFLSTYLPPLLYVVSKSVLLNQIAKVVVLTGLPRHSTTAPRGIKINVFNVKTLSYSTILNMLTLPLNKLKSKYSKFICLNKTGLILHLTKKNNDKIKYENVNEDPECFDRSLDYFSKMLLAQCGDVETNPGPELHELTMVTLNTRGLKNKNKLTQFIYRIQKSHNPSSNLIFALQETHNEYNDVKYKWKGNHIFTKGCGSRGGLITLLSDNITVSEQYDIDNEAQISLVEIIEPKHKLNLILVNIHSPCPHDENKINYYETIRNKILEIQNRHTQASVIILGDFNTTFNSYERNGTTQTTAEINTARKIQTLFLDLNLIDCWEKDKTRMTWRHGEKMSRLDRIQWSYEINTGIEAKIITDWTYTQSDHCAVIVRFKKNYDHRKTDKIERLDTFFMTNVTLKQTFLSELRTRFEQVAETQMNPHQILEYLKMTIRSIAIEVSSNYKKECE